LTGPGRFPGEGSQAAGPNPGQGGKATAVEVWEKGGWLFKKKSAVNGEHREEKGLKKKPAR